MLIVLLTFGACTPRSHDPAPQLDETTVITLERDPCYGTCPAYKLSIFGNGRVVYEGFMFVAQTGQREARISREAVLGLLEAFDKVGFFSLKDAYDNAFITDLPSVTTSLTLGGRSKTVYRYAGDSTAPEALEQLENLIDETVGVRRWTEP